jgi:hypothetical protein
MNDWPAPQPQSPPQRPAWMWWPWWVWFLIGIPLVTVLMIVPSFFGH